MVGLTGSSMGLFALVWSLMCVVSGALVTDAMLRGAPTAAVVDTEQPGEATGA